MIKDLENLTYEKRTERVTYLFPGKEEALRDLTAAFQYFNGSYKEDKGSLITKSHMEKIRCDVYKFHQEKFYVSKGRNFLQREKSFTEQCPQGHGRVPATEVFKTQLDRVLDNLIQALISSGWTR
ncbi:hypothetical protein BTVI_10915 [Pitangus sulphuratus]|nr:hypothetical protein BTVI_10915 [Pitangus sulphuratus]